NDFVNKDGRNCGRLPDNKKFWCVGNSWRVGGPTAHERTVDPAKLRCTRWSSRKFNGIKYCGSLKNRRGPFSRCLAKKRAAGRNAYSSCMFDTCANRNNNKLAKKLACENVEAFADVCGNLAGSRWKRVTGCLCPGDLVWTTCGRKCSRTCAKPTISCSFKCVARCQCPRSKPYQQGISCLNEAMCRELNLWPQPPRVR
ncbi:hypothetical protein LSAT2_002955, partial [Lamellibrachia satsuma]